MQQQRGRVLWANPTRTMKRLVRDFFELLNAEDLEGIRALLTEDAAWLPQARDMPGRRRVSRPRRHRR